MAVKGAHLTGTTFAKPTIFEIVAQQSLSGILEPAAKKIIEFIITFNPERYGHLLRYSNEFYFVFNFILQKYYLENYSASFAETFYGLKRISVTSNGKTKLSNGQKWMSLVLLTLRPYIRSKIAAILNEYQADPDRRRTRTWKDLAKFTALEIYMLGHLLYQSMELYYYIRYTSGKAVYPSPLFHVISTTLTYANPFNVPTIADLLRKLRENSFNFQDGLLLVQRSFTRTLEFSAFFIQFVHWWNQENYYTDITGLPVPPAPPVPREAKKFSGLCPICHQKRRIHTVLMVSGYVFCYNCILTEVRTNGKCPVTKYPAKEDDLVRLYVD